MSHFTCDFVAGWVSGVAGLLVGHPMDTVKVYQQVYGTTALKATRKFYNIVGVRGFFKGMEFPMLTSGLLNCMYFGFYAETIAIFESFRNGVSQKNTKLDERSATMAAKARGSYLEIFIAGFVAGAACLPIDCPGDLIKVHCQAAALKPYKPSKSFEVAKEIWSRQGWKGFYRGFVPMFWRDCPSSGLYILIYEILKDNLVYYSGYKNAETMHQFIAGGFAGSFSWLLFTPFDTVKSQMQAVSMMTPRDPSLSAAFSYVIKEQGYKGLTRGMIASSVRAFPVNAVTFVVYEHIYKLCSEFTTKPCKDVSSISDQINRDCSCQKY